MTFQITIAPDDSRDNPGLMLQSLHLDNRRITGTELHRNEWGPVEREIFDLFHLLTEHDDYARVNRAESIEELLEQLSRKEDRTYFRPNFGGELEITHYTKCLPGIRVEGEFRYSQESVSRIERNEVVADLEPIPAMKTHYDGAHCGLTDWYPEIEEGIQKALDSGEPFTTGWYASKKEIASACITSDGKTISCEASVSNDFDTNGTGEKTIPHTTDLEKIREAIYAAWDEAENDQKENETVEMLIVGQVGEDGKRKNWIETYLIDCGSGCGILGPDDSPPGDHYHQWGWQEESEDIPPEVRKSFDEKLAEGEEYPIRVGDFIMEEAS